MRRLARRRVLLLASALSLAFTFTAPSWAEDAPPPDAMEPRGFHPHQGVLEPVRAGEWKAWSVTTGNPMARALRGTTTVFRQGPADAGQVMVWTSPRPMTPILQLHPSGWLLISGGRGNPTAAVAPNASGPSPAVDRPDLLAVPPSRFLRDGFLSIGRRDGSTDIAWAPLSKGAAGGEFATSRLVLRVDDAVAPHPAPELRVLEEPEATFLAWALQLAEGRTRVGVARLRTAGDPALLLDRILALPPRTLQSFSREGSALRMVLDGAALDIDPAAGPIENPSLTPVIDAALDRLLAAETDVAVSLDAAAVAAAGRRGQDLLLERLQSLPIDAPAWDRLERRASDLLASVVDRWWHANKAPPACSTTWAERCDTSVVGGRGGSPFHEAPPCNTALVGLRVTKTMMAQHRVISSIQALYDCGGGPLDGKVFGATTDDATTVRAPDGYALGALFVRAGTRIDGFRPVWLRRSHLSLSTDRVVLGPWVGGRGGGAPVRLGSGAPIVGLHGRSGLELDALGLVEQTPGPIATGKTVRVAAIQCPSVLGDVAANRARLTSLVERAAAGGAKIIVLPEAAVTGYLSQDLKVTWQVPGKPRDPAFAEGRDPKAAAEPVPGPSTDHFAALAKRLGVWITVPLVERDDFAAGPYARAPLYFNSAVLVSPKGELAAHYRKLNPWPHPEQSWAETGDKGLAVAETEYGRVGLAICFDVHTVLPKYAAAGVWTLLYPIAWVSDAKDEKDDALWFDRTLPMRVQRAGLNVIGANWSVDAPQPWHGYGFSRVISMYGAVLAKATTRVGDEIVYADLTRAR